MNIRLNALLLGSSLALSIFTATPAMADDFNKKTELQFSEPVQIPGHVLAPGKYVFELVESTVDPNTVRVFSMDSDGHENLVATFFAIPDYTLNTPDKAVIHFEERTSGTPEAIHSWFYPGDNTGWEFVYPKEQNLAATATPDSAPVTAAAAPTMPSAPSVHMAQQKDPIPAVIAAEDQQAEEQILVAQNEVPAQPPVVGTEIQTGSTQALSTQTLPQTAGNSYLELMTGFVMLVGGLGALFLSRRKSIA
jgi:LPXTG-motif cell wall-anchored protein